MAGGSSQSLVERKIKEHKEREAWFEQRVKEYEKLVAANPSSYRTKVRLFGWLGFAYILFVLLFLVALIALIIVGVIVSHSAAIIKLAIFAAIVVVAIVRSLWVKFDAPEGMSVTRDQAPALWKEVDSIAQSVSAAKPNKIIINTQMNAAAMQLPRLGMLGFYQNILLLGMPLLLTLSPDEARSVIAHEYGHFSGQHGRFGAWAYRVNQTWHQLRENLMKSGGRGAWLFVWFVRWFSPRFAAMTFALRRQHEYEADQAAARVTSPHTAASALMRLSYLDDFAQKSFWTPFYDKVNAMPQPPAHAFVTMPSALAFPPPREEVLSKLGLALRAKTDYDDTHPCLTDRLKALNEFPANPEQTAASLSVGLEKSAAQALFGNTLPTILDKMEGDHYKVVAPLWSKEHARIAESQKMLAQLEAVTEPTEKQEITKLGLTYRLKGAEKVEPLLAPAIVKYPNNAAPKFWLGEILLERSDPAGIPLVKQAMELDRSCSEDALSTLASFYHANGLNDELEALKSEAMVHYAQAALAEQAAWTLTPGDTLLAPSLTSEQIESLRAVLMPVPTLMVAYVVKRELPGTGEHAMCLIVFPKRKMVEKGSEGSELVNHVAKLGGFPFRAKIFSPSSPKQWIKRLDNIPGAKVYEAEKK